MPEAAGALARAQLCVGLLCAVEVEVLGRVRVNDKVAIHKFACWAVLRGVIRARGRGCQRREQAQMQHKGPAPSHRLARLAAQVLAQSTYTVSRLIRMHFFVGGSSILRRIRMLARPRVLAFFGSPRVPY